MYIDDCSSLQYTQLALFIVWSNFSPLVIQVGHHPVVLSVAIVTGLASLHRSGQQIQLTQGHVTLIISSLYSTRVVCS